MKGPRLALLLTLVALWLGGLVGPAMATKTARYCADGEEAAFLAQVNAYRARNGRAPLVLSQALGAASDHHSVSMAKHDYFSHDLKPEDRTWSQNISRHGYRFN